MMSFSELCPVQLRRDRHHFPSWLVQIWAACGINPIPSAGRPGFGVASITFQDLRRSFVFWHHFPANARQFCADQHPTAGSCDAIYTFRPCQSSKTSFGATKQPPFVFFPWINSKVKSHPICWALHLISGNTLRSSLGVSHSFIGVAAFYGLLPLHSCRCTPIPDLPGVAWHRRDCQHNMGLGIRRLHSSAPAPPRW